MANCEIKTLVTIHISHDMIHHQLGAHRDSEERKKCKQLQSGVF
jgi:hypothetical protein